MINTFYVVGNNLFIFMSIALNLGKSLLYGISKKILNVLNQKSQFCHYITA